MFYTHQWLIVKDMPNAIFPCYLFILSYIFGIVLSVQTNRRFVVVAYLVHLVRSSI
jgi:hypothetical protein